MTLEFIPDLDTKYLFNSIKAQYKTETGNDLEIGSNEFAIASAVAYVFGTEYLKLASYYNSPDRSTKSTTPPVNGLCLLVSTRFQVLFHSPPGVLFTFPSRYCSTIGHQVVFSLGRWSSLLPTRFHVSRGTLVQN